MVATYQNLDRTIYEPEFKEDFERTKSTLLQCVNSGGVKEGKTYQWDISGLSGSAKERGRDGNIVRGQHPFTKVTADVQELFSEKFVINDIDAFTTNPKTRDQFAKKTIIQCNRAIDQKIVDILDSTSVEYNVSGSPITFSTLAACMKARDSLLLNDVPADDGQLWALLSIPAGSQLMRIPEFKSSDYVELRPAQNGLPAVGYRRWLDMNWKTFNGLSGKGTSAAKCYMFHASGPAHCLDGEPDPHAYWYEPEHRWEYYATIRQAGTAALTRGITRIHHDDTAAYT